MKNPQIHKLNPGANDMFPLLFHSLNTLIDQPFRTGLSKLCG